MERLANGPSTSLVTTITSAQTTLNVVSSDGFPTSGNFRILIDSEIILVTAVSGTTFTIIRGQEGTVAAGHIDGSPINHILTSGALSAFRADSQQSGLYSSLPAAGNKGVIYRCTDIPVLFRDNGIIWDGFGPIYNLNPPNFNTFTWVNQGSASFTNQFLKAPGGQSGDSCRILKIASPATPYSVTVAFSPLLIIEEGSKYPLCGLCFRESSSGKLMVFAYQWRKDSSAVNAFKGIYYTIEYWSAPTSFSSTQFQQPISVLTNPLWFKLTDDGSNRKYLISADGINFSTLYSESHTLNLTANEIGVVVNSNTVSNDCGATYLSWLIS
jgi:hypothetical protein